MGRSGNWKLDDRKLSRRKFLSWRNEKFRDVNFHELSVADDGKSSRREQAVADAESCQDANIPSEVHPANRSSISD